MQYKAADIARILGISKATVSLALNNKEGVKPQTRAQILEIKSKIESGEISAESLKKYKEEQNKNHHNSNTLDNKIIKIIIFSCDKQTAVGDELDLWSDVHTIYDKIAKEWGCSVEVNYFNLNRDNPAMLDSFCNQEDVCAVIIGGSELSEQDLPLIQNNIHKPMIVYDTYLGDSITSVQFDNYDASFTGTKYLVDNGCKNILYVARAIDTTITAQRRCGFYSYMALSGKDKDPNLKYDLLCEGNSISSINKALSAYLKEHSDIDAIFCESFHCSIATIKALKDLKLTIASKVRVIGIDSLPSYMTGGLDLSCLVVPHEDRVKYVMSNLYQELHTDNDAKVKQKIFIPCTLKIAQT